MEAQLSFSNDTLCDNILQAVFTNLDWRELCRLCCVCRAWRRSALHKSLRRELDLSAVSSDTISADHVRSLVARAQGGLRSLTLGTTDNDDLNAALAFEVVENNTSLASISCHSGFTGLTAGGVAQAFFDMYAQELVVHFCVTNLANPGDAMRSLIPLQLLLSLATDWDDNNELFDDNLLHTLTHSLLGLLTNTTCPWLQLAGIHVLRACLDSSEDQLDFIFAEDCQDLPLLICLLVCATLKNFGSNRLVYDHATRILLFFLQTCFEEVHSEMVEAGAIGLVATAMGRHEPHPCIDTQFRACEVLQLLTKCSCCQTHADIGLAIVAIVACARSNITQCHVQALACASLCNMTTETSKEITAGSAGAVEAVVAAMSAHPSEAGLQQLGCDALWNMTFNEANLKRAVDANAVEAATNAASIVTVARARASVHRLLGRLWEAISD